MKHIAKVCSILLFIDQLSLFFSFVFSYVETAHKSEAPPKNISSNIQPEKRSRRKPAFSHQVTIFLFFFFIDLLLNIIKFTDYFSSFSSIFHIIQSTNFIQCRIRYFFYKFIQNYIWWFCFSSILFRFKWTLESYFYFR